MQKRLNRRGFIKTLEAIIAVVFILSFIYFFTPKEQASRSSQPENIQKLFTVVFREVSLTPEWRSCVEKTRYVGACKDIPQTDVSYDCLHVIDTFIQDHIPASYTYICELCDKAATCLQQPLPFDKSVYTDSIFIAHQPVKIFRIYAWQ